MKITLIIEDLNNGVTMTILTEPPMDDPDIDQARASSKAFGIGALAANIVKTVLELAGGGPPEEVRLTPPRPK